MHLSGEYSQRLFKKLSFQADFLFPTIHIGAGLEGGHDMYEQREVCGMMTLGEPVD